MKNYFTDKDKQFMNIALSEAKEALALDNYPVGCVLVINGKIIGQEQNRSHSRKDFISHAEIVLYTKYSKTIEKAKKEQKAIIELYTTLEPCIMCLGAAIIHRTDRIIFACPDPLGNATQADLQKIGQWYERNWPIIDYGLEFDRSYDLFMNFLKDKNDSLSQEMRKFFPKLKEKFK